MNEFQVNQIYNENCLDTLDLIVTSPPYDNLRDYHGYSFDFENIAHQLYRVLKPGGVVVWIVADATIDGTETGTSFKQALFFKDVVGFNLHDTMIYMKENCLPVGGDKRYHQAFEYCFVLSKGSPKTFNAILEDRRNASGDKRTFRVRSVTRNRAGTSTKKMMGFEDQVRLQNVWNYVIGGGNVASDNIAHEHPAIFPEALCRDHIISWSNPGDLVYDPFMGSGTTAKCCVNLKRNWVGSELSPEYCDVAARRLAANETGFEKVWDALQEG